MMSWEYQGQATETAWYNLLAKIGLYGERNAGCALPLQPRDNLALPNFGERVLARAPVPLLGLQHTDPTPVDPPRATLAHPALALACSCVAP